MPNARELFLVQVRTPELDTEVAELRRKLTALKQDALAQAEANKDGPGQAKMAELYEQMLEFETRMAGHLGLGVALAISVLDEHLTGASLSRFDRDLRDQMNEASVSLAARQGSRLARLVAQIEAQRLVWRHTHEFMSWLAFRRGDERYPAQDRLDRLDAFGVQQRLLEARDAVVAALGVRLSAAVEGSDRFSLGNRWRMSPTPEHALERYVWPLLSYMPAATVRIERARWEYDALVESGAPGTALEAERSRLTGMLEAQLAAALDGVPEGAAAGML